MCKRQQAASTSTKQSKGNEQQHKHDKFKRWQAAGSSTKQSKGSKCLHHLCSLSIHNFNIIDDPLF